MVICDVRLAKLCGWLVLVHTVHELSDILQNEIVDVMNDVIVKDEGNRLSTQGTLFLLN